MGKRYRQVIELLEIPLAEWWPSPPPETITPELMPVTTLMFGCQPDEVFTVQVFRCSIHYYRSIP